MYNKLVKLRNKKAFTLVEMLAVIAIVAILVAILVPVIGNATTKSRAATNAANLRAVESELATLKVSNPECFVPTTEKRDSVLAESFWSLITQAVNRWFGEDASILLFDSVTAINGTLTFKENVLTDGNSIDLDGVPTAVAVQADDGMNVFKGMQMTILLIDNEIVATYKGQDGQYFNKDDFAEVAETGKFSGTGISGGTGSAIKEEFQKNYCPNNPLTGHKWEISGEYHVCGDCGAIFKHEDNLGGGLGFSSNAECDYCEANCLTEGAGIAHAYGLDNKCRHCGETECSHKGHDYNADGICTRCGDVSDKHVHSWTEGTWSNYGKHVCSVSGCKDDNHEPTGWSYQDKNVHKCSHTGCTITAAHSWEDGVCTGCGTCPICGGNGGANETTCDTCGKVGAHEHYDKDGDGDHICDFDGCTEKASECTWECVETFGPVKELHKHTCTECGETEKVLNQESDTCSTCRGVRTSNTSSDFIKITTYHWKKPSTQ